ncbi:unnamed protein product [Mytilus coruscus]|uniref:Uncharacterized protein n=1 Tax=Mytilus coruscus TaxID=42192 RepID=A0A6J8ERW2_MYTCO|nr:unnamed protein product [Mytilus coruscus]
MYKNTSSIGLGKDAFDWLDSLGRKLHIRLRRQGRYRLRERKEIRTLSENELNNFFDAVNALKNDKSNGPSFLAHHCFVDYLWEKFRERQKRLGINSETDYPPTTIPGHKPNRLMDNLRPPKTNIQGYSNSFTKQIYRYAPAPTCSNNCGGAFKGFLFCDKSKKGCVSGSRYDFIRNGGFRRVKNYYPSKGKGKRMKIPLSVKNIKFSDQPTMVSESIKAEKGLPDKRVEAFHHLKERRTAN